MDVDPVEACTAAGEETAPPTPATSHLNTYVAATVALLATFLGACKVKDDNIVQAMQQAQADRVDHWNFYQARNLREEVARATVTELTLQAPIAPASEKQQYQEAIARYERLVDDEDTKKKELMKEAQDDQKNYDALNFRDDQFDLSDAFVAVAISLLAVTALTHKRWLFWLAMLPTLGGLVMGTAGLMGWHLHPEFLTRLLS